MVEHYNYMSCIYKIENIYFGVHKFVLKMNLLCRVKLKKIYFTERLKKFFFKSNTYLENTKNYLKYGNDFNKVYPI